MSGKKIICVGTPKSIDAICEALSQASWDVHRANDLKSAKRLLKQQRFAVGLLAAADVDDVVAAEVDAFLAAHGNMEWVGCFDAPSLGLPACRELILSHLFDHHTLPVDMPRVMSCLGHALGRASLRLVTGTARSKGGDTVIIGQSKTMAELIRQARRGASALAPVLIHGESGSGKELVAQAVHRHSPRADGPFVAINCGAIQPGLIQSELFGHEKGAFTGAVGEKRGLFEAADGGTVFLDEIGDLPLDLQVNLLRFLEEGTIFRVGSSRELKLDVRVVAATHVNLDEAVAAGRFREDLFYRLNVLRLNVPSLRQRREDVVLLAEHFFDKFSADKNPRVKGFSRIALKALEAHDWPGNVRELINRVRCSMIMAEGKFITPVDLGLEAPASVELQNVLDDARTNAERVAIHSSLLQTGRNVAVSARQLGVSRMTLYRLMVKHGIHAPQADAYRQ